MWQKIELVYDFKSIHSLNIDWINNNSIFEIWELASNRECISPCNFQLLSQQIHHGLRPGLEWFRYFLISSSFFPNMLSLFSWDCAFGRQKKKKWYQRIPIVRNLITFLLHCYLQNSISGLKILFVSTLVLNILLVECLFNS